MNTLLNKIRQIADRSPVFFPLILLLVALGTFGVFLPLLGFYWDDWPPLLLSHIGGAQTIWEYWSYDRPFQSWTYYLLFPICRDSAFLWQLSAMLFRWTAALTLYATFLRILPRQRTLLRWAAVLFVVFPGFADQFASVPYGSVFLVYTLYGLSLYFMVIGLQSKRKVSIYLALSLMLSLLHLFTIEYFAGLELMRPLLIYFLLNKGQTGQKGLLRRTVIFWLPYLLVLGMFFTWRLAIYPQMIESDIGSNNPFIVQAFLSNPLGTLVTFTQTIYSDFRFLLIGAWVDRLVPVAIEVKSLTFWLSLVIGFAIALTISLLIPSTITQDELPPDKDDTRRGLLISLAIIFFGLLPIWSTLRQITRGKWSDRFDLPVMFGVAILLLTILFICVPRKKIRNILLVLLTGLSISFQIQTGNDYRKDFNRQKNFYTQLAWRIPSLEPGTTIFSPSIPTGLEADYSYSMGINLLYAEQKPDTQLDYWFSGPRYYSPSELAADPSALVKGDLRNLVFEGSAAKVVSLVMQDGCLLVLDPYSALMLQTGGSLAAYGELTNLQLIGTPPLQSSQLSNIIDLSPQETWCYYFEKGDLAQSKGDDAAAVSLYEQAMQSGLQPLEAIEYLPFVKAYSRLGRINEAVALTDLAFKRSEKTKPALCQWWQDFTQDKPQLTSAAIESVYNTANCTSTAQ